MFWPFLSPRRFELLTALSLLAAGRESIPDGLEGLASGDAQLRGWAHRLAPPLRAGEPLHQVLRAQRLVSADECALLAAAHAGISSSGDALALSRRLAAIALEARGPARGYRWIRWYPFWLGCVALLPSLLLVLAVEAASGKRYHAFGATIVSPYAMRMWEWDYPDTPRSEPATGSLALCLGEASVLVLGGLAAACWLLPRVRGARTLRLAWCPDAHRSALAFALVRHARAAPDHVPPATRIDRWLGRLRLAARAPGTPAWMADWRDWCLLCWFRGNPEAYLREAGGDLATALDGMGMVPITTGGERDWNAAEVLAQERHRRDVASALPLLGLAAIMTGVGCFAALTLELGFHWSMRDLFIPLHVEESRASVMAVAGFALLAVAQALIAVMIAQGLWTLVRLALPGMAPTRIICARLGEALRHAQDVSGALSASAMSLPMPYPGRIARALERIDGGDPSLVAALRAEWLIPGRLEREALAAESLGREALADWCAEHAGASDPGSGRWRVALPGMLATAAMVGFMTVYLLVAVLPKYERMMTYDHCEIPPLMSAVLRTMKAASPPSWSILFIPIVGMTVAISWCAYMSGWLPGQHAARRLARGRLVARAAWSGIPESEIARALAASFAWPRRALRQAGEAGDLRGIMRACGWRADDRAGLALAIERCERRRAIHRAWLTTAIMIAAPALLAIPVLIIGVVQFQVHGVFLKRMNLQAGSLRDEVPDFVPASILSPVPNSAGSSATTSATTSGNIPAADSQPGSPSAPVSDAAAPPASDRRESSAGVQEAADARR